jgi:hypothetical protein
MVLNNKNYKKGKKVGRPKLLSSHHLLRIKKFVRAEISSGHLVSCTNIQDKLDLTVSRRTLQRNVKQLNFTYEEVKKELPLTKVHKEQRLAFARLHISKCNDFKSVIFSDEKRFSLDGPDGLCSYVEYQATSIFAPQRIKRQMGGGAVMILGAISSLGNLKIKVVNGNYTAAAYIDDLKTTFIPWCKRQFRGKPWIWQQDNASIHTAAIVTEYLHQNHIVKLDWPTKSPDLNIMENIWHLMEMEIFHNRQYRSRQQLIMAIEECARNFSARTISALYSSLPGRMLKVVEAHGNIIS